MSVVEALGLAAAAFAAGAVNAIAGGGSLISFPALVGAGYPAKTANVTNTVALWPGYVGGSFGYRELLIPQRRTIALLSTSSILGAIAGSAILLSTPESAFEAIVPFLILFAALLLAVQTRIAAFVATHRPHDRSTRAVPFELHAGVFVLAVYGAYFGAGLGILTLAILGIVLPDDLQRSNALKGVLSLVINAVAVVYFAAFGPVEWGPALLMAAAALGGGYAGARLARRLRPQLFRTAVVAFSIVVALVLLVR